ncbi:MAG TPA: hypothetical protein VF691_12430 [Cytophagaceae bacterium]|jgi:hypothetical protein
MRNFDSFEKEVLTRIRTLYQENNDVAFVSLLDPYLTDKGIKTEEYRNSAYFLFDSLKYSSVLNGERSPSGDLKVEMKDLSDKIIRIGILTKYLDKEGMLLIHNNIDNQKISSYTKITNNETPFEEEISDKKFTVYLKELVQSSFFISYGLIEFVNKDFKSDVEIRILENQKIASESLDIAKTSFEEAKLALVTFKTTSENVQKTLNASKVTILEARKSLKTSDIALTTAILIGAVSIMISAATAYYTAKSYSDSAVDIATKLHPINKDLREMHSHVGSMDAQLNSLRKDTLNTRILSISNDTINSRIINKSFRAPIPSSRMESNDNAAHTSNP